MTFHDIRPIERAFLLAALCLAGSTAHAAVAARDNLVYRDGTTRSGQLTACDAARCSLDDSLVPRTEIAWIGLAQSGAPPQRTSPGAPSGAEDEVWLADGSSRSGAFVGLTLAVVRFGSESLDRAAVRWIRLATPGLDVDTSVQALESDVLVRRDGSSVQGELLACNKTFCALENDSVTREELEWIGVGVARNAAPPEPPPDPDQDAIGLYGGPLQATPFLGISGDSVRTGRGTFPRIAVDWIYLAPRPASQGPGVAWASERERADEANEASDPPPSLLHRRPSTSR